MVTHQEIVDKAVESGLLFDPVYWWANTLGKELHISNQSIKTEELDKKVKYVNEKGLLCYAALSEWIDLDTYLDWMRKVRSAQMSNVSCAVNSFYDPGSQLTWREATLLIDRA